METFVAAFASFKKLFDHKLSRPLGHLEIVAVLAYTFLLTMSPSFKAVRENSESNNGNQIELGLRKPL